MADVGNTVPKEEKVCPACAKAEAEKSIEPASEEKSYCCGDGIHEHKHRDDVTKKKLMNRLKRIEGQIRGIEGMLDRDAYCPDILVQVSAVNCALNSFNKELLAQHIKNCVVEDVRDGNEETIDELVKVIQKIMK
jgi:DNA-binding FrmR family transcriptional regulator